MSHFSQSTRTLLAVALATTLAGICHAQEFSADAVYKTTPQAALPSSAKSAPAMTTTARVYVSKDRLRLESSGLTDQTMIVDGGNRTSVVLYPDRKSYSDLGSRPSQYFRVTDAENACPDWQKATGHELACVKAEKELVGERETVKYENAAKSGMGAGDAIWIDVKLHYVIKWRAGETLAELKNIKPGPQAPTLFEVPAGYQPLRAGKKHK